MEAVVATTTVSSTMESGVITTAAATTTEVPSIPSVYLPILSAQEVEQEVAFRKHDENYNIYAYMQSLLDRPDLWSGKDKKYNIMKRKWRGVQYTIGACDPVEDSHWSIRWDRWDRERSSGCGFKTGDFLLTDKTKEVAHKFAGFLKKEVLPVEKKWQSLRQELQDAMKEAHEQRLIQFPLFKEFIEEEKTDQDADEQKRKQLDRDSMERSNKRKRKLFESLQPVMEDWEKNVSDVEDKQPLDEADS